MPDTRIEFRYTGGDVTSAQRLRFMKGTQLRIIGIFWLITIVFLGLHLIFPQVFTFLSDTSWSLLLNITLVYIVTMLVLLFITPWIDYLFNRFWRLHLEMAFNDKQLKLSAVRTKKPKSKKASSGLVVKKEDVQEYLENKRVFVVVYGAKKQYFIVPKSAFASSDAVDRFRSLLNIPKVSQPEPVDSD